MANSEERLFGEFQSVTTEQWEAAIAVDLKGADYNKKLVWRTAEGFTVRPYYRTEDLAGLQFMGNTAGRFPFVRGNGKGNSWRVHQHISANDPVEANLAAKKAVEDGAESLGFGWNPETELSVSEIALLLKDIDPTKTELQFCSSGQKWIIEPVMNWAAAFEKESVRILFNFDPLYSLSMFGQFGCTSPDGKECFEFLAATIARYKEFKHVRFIGVNGAVFGDCGSTIVEELAFSLAVGHEYLVRLTEAGLSATAAAKALYFRLSISSNYFMEIAKLRAGRLLWANIVKAYDPDCNCAEKMLVCAQTSAWNQTICDPYVNMLRATTEAMSAVLGGVHSLEVTPFDTPYEMPDDFAQRIARNVQLLLKNESHFDVVTDPAGGSYYIENLTDSLSKEAWKLFKEVEDAGGYTAALRGGMITSRVEASAAARDNEVAKRRITLLGTNQYPDFRETAIKEAAPLFDCPCAEGLHHLKLRRGAEGFERLRRRVYAAKVRPTAFMLTCGNLAMARARAQFSCNFFASAGIKVQDNTYFHTTEEGIDAALASGAQIVVVCSSDDDYPTVAPEIFKAIGSKAIVVVAGAPASADELKAAGISHFISVRDNVLETLTAYVNELGIE
ncbi:MAG: methylmalonyl-CoA mutase family protein [Tidjanibacter sp.]|nr:methylmalonyl-CoA mutase family protein [Tidjanibacter sp.]